MPATDSLPDTFNKFLVGSHGDKLQIISPRVRDPMTHDEALNLAAWLVAMAYGAETDFDELLAAVKAC